MPSNITLFDPLERMHISWTQESRDKYFQSKVHELINSKSIKGLNLEFTPEKASFKGGYGKSILLSGNKQFYVISKKDIEANSEIAKIHSEALLILSGQAMPGYAEKPPEEPKKPEESSKGWFSWFPGFSKGSSTPQVKSLPNLSSVTPGPIIPGPAPTSSHATSGPAPTSSHATSGPAPTHFDPTASKKPAPGFTIPSPTHPGHTTAPINPGPVTSGPATHFGHTPAPTIPSTDYFEPNFYSDGTSDQDLDDLEDPFVPTGLGPNPWKKRVSPKSSFNPPSSPSSSVDFNSDTPRRHSFSSSVESTSPILPPLGSFAPPPSPMFMPAASPSVVDHVLQAENADLRLQLAQMQLELDALKAQDQDRSNEHMSLRSELDNALDEVQKILQENADLTSQLNTEHQRLEEAQDQLRDAQTQLIQLETQRNLFRTHNEEKLLIFLKNKQEIKDLNAKITEQNSIISRLETQLTANQEELKSLRERAKKAESDRNTVITENSFSIDEYEKTKQKLHTEIMKLTSQLAELTSNYKQEKAEIEAQLNQEKENTKKFAEKADSLKRLNINYRNQLRDKEDELEALKAALAAASTAAGIAVGASSSSGTNSSDLTSQISKLNQKIKRLESQLRNQATLQSQLNSNQTEISTLQSENRRLNRELNSLKRNHRNNLADLERQLASAKKLNSRNSNESAAKIQRLSDEIMRLKSDFHQSKAELAAKIHENTQLQNELRRKTNTLTENAQEIPRLRNANTDLDTQLRRLNTELRAKEQEHNLNLEEARNDAKAARAGAIEVRGEISNLKREQARLIDEHNRQLTALRDELKKAQAEHINETPANVSKVNELESELRTLNRDFELEKAKLQKDLDAEKAKLTTSKQALANALERESKLNLEKIGLENTQRALIASHKRAIIALERQIRSGDASISRHEGTIQSLERKIATLEEELHKLQGLNSQQSKVISSLNARKEKQNNHASTIEHQLGEANKALKEARKQLQAQIEENRRLNETLKKLSESKPTNVDTQKLDEINAQLLAARSRISDLERKLAQKETESDTDTDELESISSELSQATSRSSSIQQQLTGQQLMREHAERIEAIKKDYEQALAQERVINQRLNTQLKTKRADLELLLKENNDIRNMQKAHEKEIARLKKEKTKNNAVPITPQESEQLDIINIKDENNGLKVQVRRLTKELELERANIQAQESIIHKLEQESAKQEHINVEERHELEAEIIRLENDIKSLNELIDFSSIVDVRSDENITKDSEVSSDEDLGEFDVQEI